MARRTFAHRTETFGFDTPDPWAMSAFRLLFHTSRAFQPLVDAWEERHPGTRKALDRLVAMGFVAYQPPVVIDTRTAETAEKPTRAVRRYRTTAKGKRLVNALSEDLRCLEDEYPHTKTTNVKGVARLLKAFDLEDSHAVFGLSSGHATEISGLPDRNGRWWVERFLETGVLRELPERYADVREVVPAHWRITRLLCRQLEDVLDEFHSAPDTLKIEFHLRRSRFLADVDPARVGISGATDFDHDIACQRILAALLRSPRCAADGIFTVEPRIILPVNIDQEPWAFDADSDGRLFYLPDAELRERDSAGSRRSILEYERYQTRRDGWNHIERFLGYLHTRTFPFEGAVLRFVVDSDSRVRSYVKLIEAFATHALENPDLMPLNNVTLAVSSLPKVLAAPDPLDPRAWYRVDITRPADGSDTTVKPVLYDRRKSPYDDYFARSVGEGA